MLNLFARTCLPAVTACHLLAKLDPMLTHSLALAPKDLALATQGKLSVQDPNEPLEEAPEESEKAPQSHSNPRPRKKRYGERIAQNAASVMKRRREELCLTQVELAELSGVPIDSIRNYESIRRKRMSFEAAIAISRALKISSDELAGELTNTDASDSDNTSTAGEE